MSDTDQLPRAYSQERLTLATMLAWPDCAPKVFSILHTRDFTTRQHHVLYDAMLAQNARGLLIDPQLLAAELKNSRAFEGDSAAGFILELALDPGVSVHLETYAHEVREASRKRRLLAMGESITEAARNGQQSHDVFKSAVADFDDYRREAIAGQSLLADAVSVGQFVQQEHTVEYLVPNVLTAGQAAVMSARAKSLKTATAVDLFVSMATATKFLNYWQVPEPIKCGIISAESGAATVSELLQRTAASKGIEAKTIENCLVSTRCPRLRSVEWQQEIRRFIEDNELRALAIDPTYLAMSGVEQNNLAAMGDELAPVTDIIADKRSASKLAI